MINIVTWLGNTKGRHELAAVCARSNIRILAEDFESVTEFLDAFENMESKVDALVLSDRVLTGTDKRAFFNSVRSSEPNLRIIIVFPGYRNQYIEEQISEYKEVYGVSDIIYEGQRLDADCFVEVIRRGYIYDYSVNVYDEPEEVPRTKPPPKPCVTVGILGLTHGCGTTSMTVKTAKYMAEIAGDKVKAVDLSGTGSLRFAKDRGVMYIVHEDVDFPRLKKNSRGIVIDFGAPFLLSPKGKLLETAASWDEEMMRLFRDCDLKLILCFAKPWHIGKMKYLKRDKQWRRRLDDTYIFLLDAVPDGFVTKTKQAIYSRDSEEIRGRLVNLLARGGGDAM